MWNRTRTPHPPLSSLFTAVLAGSALCLYAPAPAPAQSTPQAQPAPQAYASASASLPADVPSDSSSSSQHVTAPGSAVTRVVLPRPSNVYRPFGALAVAVKGGVAGIGFDVATPLSQRFNLRGGASFFSYSSSYLADGTSINGDLKLRSVNMSVDWYPFNNRFRISPGVNLYNGNSLNATASVPGGQTFDLDDATYTSSAADPIHGSASFDFGHRTAPTLTIGSGNIIPRHGEGHMSIPVELGFQYIGDPHLNLALQGTACSNGFCQNTATNPQFQANLQAENNDLNNDIHLLRFFPIFSVGVGYRF